MGLSDGSLSLSLYPSLCHSPSLSDGLKAYTAPVGHVMQLSGMPVYLNDSTYDGGLEQG